MCPREKGFVLWGHCQNLLDDPRRMDCSSDVSGNALLTTLRKTAKVRYIEIHYVIRLPESEGKVKHKIFRADVTATGAMILRM